MTIQGLINLFKKMFKDVQEVQSTPEDAVDLVEINGVWQVPEAKNINTYV